MTSVSGLISPLISLPRHTGKRENMAFIGNSGWTMKLRKPGNRLVDQEPQSFLERDYKRHRRGGSFG